MAINQIGNNIQPAILPDKGLEKKPLAGAPDFKEALQKAVEDKNSAEALSTSKPEAEIKFSNHSVERMRARGIHFTPQEMTAIRQAVAEAQQKGAKETLILNDKSAMIVSVKNNTVVTVMDKGALKNNLFTNIDSTVLI